jgi:hypothetical protein
MYAVSAYIVSTLTSSLACASTRTLCIQADGYDLLNLLHQSGSPDGWIYQYMGLFWPINTPLDGHTAGSMACGTGERFSLIEGSALCLFSTRLLQNLNAYESQNPTYRCEKKHLSAPENET